MAKNSLYIIGNGFDLHHEIPSGCRDFGIYVKSLNSRLCEIFERYISCEGDWSKFEEALANIDAELILDDIPLAYYGADDWSDSGHHDFQYEVEQIADALSKKLKMIFTHWILTLQIPDSLTCQTPLLNLDLDARYLTFNYTDTLEKLYHVSSDKILYIHNKAIDLTSDLILGHAFNPINRSSLNQDCDLESQDTRITEAKCILDDYFSSTYKPVDRVIRRHEFYFDSLKNINKIYVLGHSLSSVDVPYFKQIVSRVANSEPDWMVTYYCDSEISDFKKTLLELGVAESKIDFIKMCNLCRNSINSSKNSKT